MNVRKIKRMCMVKGCKSRDTYTISKSRDFGNTVIICPDCLREALALIAPPVPPALPTLEELLLNDVFKQQFEKVVEDEIGERLKRTDSDNGETDGGDTDIEGDKGKRGPIGYNWCPKCGSVKLKWNADEDINICEDCGWTDREENPGSETQTDGDSGETPQNKQPPGQTDPEAKKYICSKCGKVCGSQIGLASHERACKPE